MPGRRTVPVCYVSRGKAGRFAYADPPHPVAAFSDSDAPINPGKPWLRSLGLFVAEDVEALVRGQFPQTLAIRENKAKGA